MTKRIPPLPSLPDPITAQLVKRGKSYRLEIPARHADKPIASMPGMTPRLLQGARIWLREVA